MNDSVVIEGLETLRVEAPSSVLPKVLTETGLADGYVTRATPIGEMFIAFSSDGVTACVPTGDEPEFLQAYQERTGRIAVRAEDLPDDIGEAVDDALRTGRARSVPFDLSSLSGFGREVLRKTAEIPPGEVRPYTWVAREIDRPRAVRAVGTALRLNPVPVLIPCHRVVRSDGSVGKYAFGPENKTRLLESEGVAIDLLQERSRRGIRYVGNPDWGIYCYPTCRAGHIDAPDLVEFGSAAEAEGAGYRACLECRPAA